MALPGVVSGRVERLKETRAIAEGAFAADKFLKCLLTPCNLT
jgi:hypothetical protein